MVVAPHFMLGEERPSPRDGRGSRVDSTGLELGVLFDRLLDAVVIARLTTGRIVAWNPAAQRLFGFTAQEAIGQPIEILMPEPIAPLHRAGLERYARTGHGLIVDAAEPVEMPARTKSGEDLRIEMSLSELQNSRGERFAVAVIRDAMHHKHLELTNLELAQARVARSEAEAALATRDELLDAVSSALHAPPDADELQRLATALADFRRLRGGNLTLYCEEADLVDIVHAAADCVRKRTTGRRLLVFAPPSLPANLDPARTRHVVEQVLDDAMQRSPEGSQVEVRLEQPSSQTAQLTVRAEGADVSRPFAVGVHLSRAVMQRQGGALAAALTSTGSLKVVITLPASLTRSGRKPLRRRRAR